MYPHRLFYFPSYEIIMDELRDYRYYSQDLIHINNQATQYIWEKFDHALLSQESHSIIQEMTPLLNMMYHRPLFQEGDAYRKMVRQKDEKLKLLKEKYPFLALENILK